MCGIVGFWDFRQQYKPNESASILEAMTGTLMHRGPDGQGLWHDPQKGLYFGHTRLAIVDLSAAGHQPMVSPSKAAVLTYNGEIYNAPELRAELQKKGCVFRGHSDTEVLLHACEQWGVESAVQQLMGMFAFAYWDARTNALFLVRDRIGIKPLYYGIHNQVLFFSSELKALHKHPKFLKALNLEAVGSFLKYGYVPCPDSIFKDIFKLEPGTVKIFKTEKATTVMHEKTVQYWDLKTIAQHSKKETTSVAEYEALIEDAVQRRMLADVPLGAFLSGGIDSSLVVALMQKNSFSKINTFSIGFKEQSYDEAPHAKAVAMHLGTEHHELYVSEQDMLSVIPSLSMIYDEPFADSSQIPTYLVSKLARQKVTVSLSGDGGDELFGGYPRYVFASYYENKLFKIPPFFRKKIGFLLKSIRPSVYERLSKWPFFKIQNLSWKVYKVADWALASSAMELYLSLIQLWSCPETILNPNIVSHSHGDASFRTIKELPIFFETMQLMDQLYYLPDDILTKVDRASMSLGLEARVPLLDHRVIEKSWTLPLESKIIGTQGKQLLKQILYQYVPSSLIDRPKRGFGIPLNDWLRQSTGPLREWAESLLNHQSLSDSGIFNVQAVRNQWERYLRGQEQPYIWSVLILQDWIKTWL